MALCSHGFLMWKIAKAWRSISSVAVLTAWCATTCALAPSKARASERIDFARDVLPILQDRCHKCHGGVRRQNELSFQTRNDALALLPSGTRAIVPGKPDESELLRRVAARDDTERMPPSGDSLTQNEIDVLNRWIAGGAPWDRHWSFEPVRRPVTSDVAQMKWVRHPIDQFVLARLEASGIHPSPEAERHILIRRLYLDLVGLLPPIEEAEAFSADSRPDSYQRLVDRLLANPHFGERWARHWLDQARYADTDGFEVDGPRPNAWRWRDWVIAAFNNDLPYDQFTLEQLAGDLLPDATLMQTAATSFHRQSLTNREGGIDQGEARYKELVDRVNATGTIWLGITIGCAQCHHHPYDPFSQRDFYQLYAYFNNTDDTEIELVSELDTEKPGKKRKDGELKIPVVARSEKPRKTGVYHRGDFLQPRETVESGVLETILPLPSTRCSSGLPDRLELAKWIIHAENPLTPRVAANQLWIRLVGAGLVRTPDDFGTRGAPPSHPQLLDWLADEYQDCGWSTKRMIRQIVTSSTYRQSSRYRQELRTADPLNSLWHRQNRFRVEAELVRDISLSAAGLLVSAIGGPSVYPPMADEVAKLSFRSNYVWPTSTGSDRYRRGMYTFFKRTLPHPNLDTFDCPDATAALMRRETSNTPLQALTTLNNEVFWEAGQALAQRVLAEAPPADRERINYGMRICLGRDASGREQDKLQTLLDTSRNWYRQHIEDATALVGEYRTDGLDIREAAAWVATLSVVLNLDEFLTRE